MSNFWDSQFGNEYHLRNIGRVDANVHFFKKALWDIRADFTSVLELGCGTGENLAAIARLAPWVDLNGVEINEAAAELVPAGKVVRGDLLKAALPHADLVFTKGVLIHIPPDDLPRAYARLFEQSNRYILIAEYHSPTPVMVEYRGHKDRLWKRDFAKELCEAYPSLELVNCGFAWSNDPAGAQDDLTFFLFKKTEAE